MPDADADDDDAQMTAAPPSSSQRVINGNSSKRLRSRAAAVTSSTVSLLSGDDDDGDQQQQSRRTSNGSGDNGGGGAWSWVGSECHRPEDIQFPAHLRRAYELHVKPRCPDLVAMERQLKAGSGGGSAVSRRTLTQQRSECRRKCLPGGNMNCLNLLGQQAWENEDYESTFRAYCRRQRLLDDDPSAQRRRQPGTPVGLKNLGATCYMNALLQTWYFHRAFRDGVYGIDVGRADDVSTTARSAIHHLQTLFTHLQISDQAVYNPQQLVQVMGLNATEQQDANEFYRLFVSMLASEVDEDVRRGLVTGNFLRQLIDGTYSHTTECLNCHHKSRRREVFSQIELLLRDRCSVEDCLREYLHAELLEGANQYLCSRCSAKHDASRYTQLHSLPQVLNFQLMRFVYDFEGEVFMKKKMTAMIKFPLVLDMREFVKPWEDERDAQQQSFVYDLHAVLIHAGDTAYSGHYIAHVHDRESGRWFRCNDEYCGPLDMSDRRFTFDLHPKQEIFEDANTQGATNDDVIVDVSKTKSKSNKRVIHDDGQEGGNDSDVQVVAPASSSKQLPPPPQQQPSGTFQSRNAYMLIYIRRDAKTNAIEASSPPVNPPVEAVLKVTEENGQFQKECENYQTVIADVRQRFDQVRQERLDFLNRWRVYNHDGGNGDEENRYAFVPTEWLVRWLQHPLKDGVEAPWALVKNKSDGADDDDKKTESEVDRRVICTSTVECPHGRLSLSKLSDVKRINQAALQYLISERQYHVHGHLLVGDEALCKGCVAERFKHELHLIAHADQYDLVQSLVKMFDGASGVASSSSSNKRKRSTAPSLTPAELLLFQSRYPWIQLPDVTIDATKHHDGWWVSKAWLAGWMKKVPKFEGDDNFWEVSPLDKPFRADVLCEHDNLQPDSSNRRLIPHSAWSFFAQIIPRLPEQLSMLGDTLAATAPACHACSQHHQLLETERTELKNQAAQDRQLLRDMYQSVSVRDLAWWFDIRDVADEWYLVSATFSDAWRKYVRQPDRFERPSVIDNSDLFCQHGLLKYSLDHFTSNGELTLDRAGFVWEGQSGDGAAHYRFRKYRPPVQPPQRRNVVGLDPVLPAAPFVPVSGEEWRTLRALYPDIKGGTVQFTMERVQMIGGNGHPSVHHHLSARLMPDPRPADDRPMCSELCHECWKQWRLDWAEGKVLVRRHDVDDVDGKVAELLVGAESMLRMVETVDVLAAGDEQPVAETLTTSTSSLVDLTVSSPPPSRASGRPKRAAATLTPVKSADDLSSHQQRRSTRQRLQTHVQLTIQPTTTVRELKLQIMQQWEVVPSEQRLVYGGRFEMFDDQATMKDLEVVPSVAPVDLILSRRYTDGLTEDMVAETEYGFAGTFLHQQGHQQQSQQQSNQSSMEDVVKQVETGDSTMMDEAVKEYVEEQQPPPQQREQREQSRPRSLKTRRPAWKCLQCSMMMGMDRQQCSNCHRPRPSS